MSASRTAHARCGTTSGRTSWDDFRTPGLDGPSRDSPTAAGRQSGSGPRPSHAARPVFFKARLYICYTSDMTSEVATYRAYARWLPSSYGSDLNVIVVPSEADLPNKPDWEDLDGGAIERIVSVLDPDGAHAATREEAIARVGLLLGEEGWIVSSEETIDAFIPQVVQAFAVERTPRFRVQLVEMESGVFAQVASTDGTVVSLVPVASQQPLGEALDRAGWVLLPGRIPGWTMDVFYCAVGDWPALLMGTAESVTQVRASTVEVESRRRACIREALLAGVPAKTVAQLSELTVQRVYQIRDGRR